MAYAVGGWSHEDWCAPLASVEALDLAADGAAFGAAAPLAVARGDKALAATGEALYVVGGEHNNGCATGSAPVDDVEALGDGAGEWSVEADIPEERFRTAAAAVGDYLYVFGGQAAESTSCTGFAYARRRRAAATIPRDAIAAGTASPSRTTSGACRSTRTTTTGATTATTATSRTPSPSRPPSPSPRSCSSPSPAPRSSRPAARRRRRPRTRSRSRARSSCRTARTCRPSCEEDASAGL